MVKEGAARDEIMILVGMLLMLDQLDYSCDSQASSPHGGGVDSSSNRIHIRPIFENTAAISSYN